MLSKLKMNSFERIKLVFVLLHLVLKFLVFSQSLLFLGFPLLNLRLLNLFYWNKSFSTSEVEQYNITLQEKCLVLQAYPYEIQIFQIRYSSADIEQSKYVHSLKKIWSRKLVNSPSCRTLCSDYFHEVGEPLEDYLPNKVTIPTKFSFFIF